MRVVIGIWATAVGLVVSIGGLAVFYWGEGLYHLGSGRFLLLPNDTAPVVGAVAVIALHLLFGAVGAFVAYRISRSSWPPGLVLGLALGFGALIILAYRQP